jgi:hypothetical protein
LKCLINVLLDIVLDTLLHSVRWRFEWLQMELNLTKDIRDTTCFIRVVRLISHHVYGSKGIAFLRSVADWKIHSPPLCSITERNAFLLSVAD